MNNNLYEEEKRNNFNYRNFLYLAIAFLAGMTIALYILPNRHRGINNAQINKLNEVMEYINTYYFDTLNSDQLFEQTISTLLQSLDPHSTYSNAEENKSSMELLEGAFEGIGIQFSIMNDTVMVVATVTGGPSEKIGIRAGDRIVTVDGKSIAGIGIQNEDVLKLLRGKKNSKVVVGIHRQGFNEEYQYTITRDIIPTFTLDVSYMINNNIGYIKINQFGSTTDDEFEKAIEKLQKQGMTKMILDLRGNAGGFLEAAIRVCDQFLPNKEMIVYTEGLRSKTEQIHASRYGLFENGGVAILIDDFSASASEIVAGAIQDNDRGIVVGRRSFGKGLVQRQFELSDHSTIRLTISRYHTPSGRCIQRDYKQGSDAYYEELYKRFVDGEMISEDSIKLDKDLAFKTKKGRTVYGGGGIMPDFFVPIDQDEDLSAFNQVLNSSAIIQYAFNYTTSNKEILLKRFPDAKTFIREMTVSDAQLKELIDFHDSKNNNSVTNISNRSKKELKVWIKALIGRNLYQEEAFYPIINTTDNVIIKAVKELERLQD